MTAYVTPARAIAARLGTSSALLAVLSGGVWSQPLTRTGPKATPAAFAATPPHRPLPAIVVPDEGEDADGLGPSGAFNGFPLVWFYADDDPNGAGRLAIEQAVPLAHTALSGWTFATGQGTGAEVHVVGRLGIQADPVDDSRIVDYLRLQVDGLWRLEI